jgi:hypothetical protein
LLLRSAVRPHTTPAPLALGSVAMASRKSLANCRLPGRLVTWRTRQLSVVVCGSVLCPHASTGTAKTIHRKISAQQARTLYPGKGVKCTISPDHRVVSANFKEEMWLKPNML